MRLLESARERELLANAERSLGDCRARIAVGEFDNALQALLIGIDVLAQLNARVDGRITTESNAKKGIGKRFVAFLRAEIPEWKIHEIQWEGETIRIDLSELSYVIRCKQLHEYSDLSSDGFPIRIRWDRRQFGDPFMWVQGNATSNFAQSVDINGIHLLQRLVNVAEKYVGLFGATPTQVSCRVDPFGVYRLLPPSQASQCVVSQAASATTAPLTAAGPASGR